VYISIRISFFLRLNLSNSKLFLLHSGCEMCSKQWFLISVLIAFQRSIQ
jgi:hypothetical protein